MADTESEIEIVNVKMTNLIEVMELKNLTVFDFEFFFEFLNLYFIFVRQQIKMHVIIFKFVQNPLRG